MAALSELHLEAGTRIVGDAHLHPEDADGVEDFVAWLDALIEAPRLVVLGDLFEYWVGPRQARSGPASRVVEALRARTSAGCAIELVPGNRDFLLDASFERASGVRLHPEGFVGRLPGGVRALVVHGDELCTRDRGYQRLRRVLRSGPVTWLAPRVPGPVAGALARRLRRASTRAVAAKPAPERAQQADACRALAARHACATLICGHAHAFRDERLADGPRWLVVDAFGGPRDTLVVTAEGDLKPESSRERAP